MVMTHTCTMCRTHTRLESFTAFGINEAPRNNPQAEIESQFEGREYGWLRKFRTAAEGDGVAEYLAEPIFEQRHGYLSRQCFLLAWHKMPDWLGSPVEGPVPTGKTPITVDSFQRVTQFDGTLLCIVGIWAGIYIRLRGFVRGGWRDGQGGSRIERPSIARHNEPLRRTVTPVFLTDIMDLRVIDRLTAIVVEQRKCSEAVGAPHRNDLTRRLLLHEPQGRTVITPAEL